MQASDDETVGETASTEADDDDDDGVTTNFSSVRSVTSESCTMISCKMPLRIAGYSMY